MRYKRKLIALLILVTVLTAIQLLMPYYPNFTIIYADYVFVPYQSFRNLLFGWSQFSFGDVFYFIGGLLLLMLLAKWIYYIGTIRKSGKLFMNSLFNTIVGFAIVYLVFMIGWGGNYYKPTLVTYWSLDKTKWEPGKSEYEYNKFLTEELNKYAYAYKPLHFKKVRRSAMGFYKQHTDCKARLHGLNIKPSIYGFLMQHLGIQGYYNPITGEAQVNRYLPSFMLPFVVLHEMAHQAGIAAEDDANLLAYSIGLRSGDASFKYSSYLNMWLYNHYRIKQEDSVKAEQLMAELNPITLSHIDTLRQIRDRYRSDFSFYSGKLYDLYLKLLQQEEGIGSYNRSIETAWSWEIADDSIRRRKVLDIP
ncbi:MAG: DUF3810 family protein [Chitinophagales bacterium]|nr:DUF3810 family protein [Chitinophagaceae bacterium]MCB9065022.1 DUF3810 family protein [Chitinophagales bacterium]